MTLIHWEYITLGKGREGRGRGTGDRRQATRNGRRGKGWEKIYLTCGNDHSVSFMGDVVSEFVFVCFVFLEKKIIILVYNEQINSCHVIYVKGVILKCTTLPFSWPITIGKLRPMIQEHRNIKRPLVTTHRLSIKNSSSRPRLGQQEGEEGRGVERPVYASRILIIDVINS